MNKFQSNLLNSLYLELSVNQFHAAMESGFDKLDYLMRIELLEKSIYYYNLAVRVNTIHDNAE